MAYRNGQALEFVTTPTGGWLRESLKTCRSRLLVASPYVNDAFAQLLSEAYPTVKTTLVTKTDLRDFAIGSSNLETLCNLANQGVHILSLTGLHAKVYVFDRSRALITSANATWSGLLRNREFGVAVSEPSAVSQIASLVLTGLGADIPPKKVSASELSKLRHPVEALRSSVPNIPPVKVPDTPEVLQDASFQLPDGGDFVKTFTGWTRLTLECVLSLPNDTFSLSDMYAVCTPIAERRYPRNQFIPDKIRQQLQLLRNLGLVEFLGNGEYRRTIRR